MFKKKIRLMRKLWPMFYILIFVQDRMSKPLSFVGLLTDHYSPLHYADSNFLTGRQCVSRMLMFSSCLSNLFVANLNEGGEPMDQDLPDISGNKRRRLWKKACTTAALDVCFNFPLFYFCYTIHGVSSPTYQCQNASYLRH